MAHPHTLLAVNVLRNVPTWASLLYVAVAVTMAVGLTVWFLAAARTREPNRPGGAGPAVVLVVLFFPLLAISIIWPITLPVALWIVLRRPPREGRGLDVVRATESAARHHPPGESA